jgi:thiamine-monophosphate kinase
VLLSCDILLDGIHFDTSKHRPEDIGRKAAACSLSDCAAMAARPIAMLCSVALPANYATEDARRLLGGLQTLAEAFDCSLVGGDTTRWTHPLAVDVTVLAGAYPGIEPVRRSRARVGDALYVTGPLGGSLLGRHMSFGPRVNEARALAVGLGPRLHAMMDLSDGLSLDLWRMAEASGVGADLREDWVEACIHDDARRLAKEDGRAPLDHALSDGEDFELLLAVEGEAAVPGVTLHPVGRITAAGMVMRHSDGTTSALARRGFVH